MLGEEGDETQEEDDPEPLQCYQCDGDNNKCPSADFIPKPKVCDAATKTCFVSYVDGKYFLFAIRQNKKMNSL